MEVKDHHRAVIEFLLFEGCAVEEIMIRLRNVYGSAAYHRASVINKVRRGDEEL
jgi:hypothetical protein